MEIPSLHFMRIAESQWNRVSRLILGSSSWSRKTLLAELGAPEFETISPDIDETSIEAKTPRDLVENIALAKARALMQREDVTRKSSESGKTLLICGDALVSHKGQLLGKPANAEAARKVLHSYASAPATTVASVVVVDVMTRRYWSGVDEAEVYFHPFPNSVIDELIATGGALESAGALRIEHPLVEQYTECIIGHRSAVMGFSQPLAGKLLSKALKGDDGQMIDTDEEEITPL